MVIVDKNLEELKNGRRSRGESPVGHSESSDEEERGDGGMRVGGDFQVKVPAFNPDIKPIPNKADAILVWAPHPDLHEAKIDEYIHIAKEKHGYNMEQALGMLFWHKHNVEKALADLPNFTPFPDEWTVEDKVLFEQAFSFHGKSFHRIRQMLPDKSIASLVKYYYSWKKTRSRTSLMDRQVKKQTGKEENESDEGTDDESKNSEQNDNKDKDNSKDVKNTCSNCKSVSTQMNATPKGTLCNTCCQYWRRTGVMRSTETRRHEHGQHRHNTMKHKRKPPRGMYLNMDDIKSMVSGSPGQAESLLKTLDTELVSIKRNVQNNKQMVAMLKHKTLGTNVDQYKNVDANPKINSKWTNDELLLAVQGVRKYGKNFAAIAEVIGNKLESHVRSFFINFRRRYNLDEVLSEYEAEHGLESVKDEPDKEVESMEIDSQEGDRSNSAAATTNNLPATSSTPPPLLKQPQPGALKSQQRLLPNQRTILQQPPPLIKPNTSAASKPTSTSS